MELPAERTLRFYTALLYFFGFAGFYVALLLVFTLGTSEASRFVTIPYRAFVFFLGLGMFIYAARRRMYVATGFVPVLVAIFWVLWFVRLGLDVFVYQRELGLSPTEYLQRSVGITIVPMLAFGAVMTERSSRAGFRAIIISSAVFCSLAYFSYGEMLSYGGYRSLRYLGFDRAELISPLAISYGGALLASLALWRLVYFKDKPVIITFYALALLGGAYIATIGVTRGALVALALAFGVLCGCNLGNRGAMQKLLILGAVGGLLLSILLFTTSGGSTLGRFTGLLIEASSLNEDAGSGRIGLYSRAISQFFASPWIGSSVEEMLSKTYPHNAIIEAFMATGVVGGLVYIGLLYYGVRQTWRLLSKSDPRGWVGIVFLNYAIMGMFSGSIIAPGIWYSIYGLLASQMSKSQGHRFVGKHGVLRIVT